MTDFEILIDQTQRTLFNEEKVVASPTSADKTTSQTLLGKSTQEVQAETLSNTLNRSRGVYNVVSDYSWTVSPQRARNRSPFIQLNEKRLLTNSLVNQAAYYLTQVSQNNFQDQINQGIASNFNDILTQAENAEFQDQVKDFGNGVLGAIQQLISTSTGNTRLTESLLSKGNVLKGDINVLKSYDKLYLTLPTLFQYILPYFPDQYRQISNIFSSTNPAQANRFNLINTAVSRANDIIQNAAQIINITRPGVYIETPQYFDFSSSSGQPITVQFNLYNTLVTNSFADNYKFLWLLIFQNLPYKSSFTTFEPPKLYEVFVPGTYYTPYAYISNLSINFIGTQHKLRQLGNITIQGLRNQVSQDTIIPEAYEVQIQLTPLVKDVSNFQLVANDLSSKIQVVEL